MLVWNEHKLFVPEADADPKALFEESFRIDLGPVADEAWTICSQFAAKEMWFDTFVILERALNRKNTTAVGVAITELKDIWQIVVERDIPSRSQMTPLDEETLANSFLIADLAIIRSG